MRDLSGISKESNTSKPAHPSDQKPIFSFDELIGRVQKFFYEWLNLDWIVNFFSPKGENNSSPSTSPATPNSQPNSHQISKAPSQEIANQLNRLSQLQGNPADAASKLISQTSENVTDPIPAIGNIINTMIQTREHEPISSEKRKELIEKAAVEAVEALIQSFPNLNEEKYKQDAKERAISQINPEDDILDQQETIKTEILKRLNELKQEQINIDKSIDGIINELIEEKFPSLNFNEFKNFIKKETRKQFENSSEILRMADISSQQEQIKDFVSRKLKALDEIDINLEVESKLTDLFWGTPFKPREEIRKEVEKEREEKIRETKSKSPTTVLQHSSNLQPTTTQWILEPPSLTQRTQTKVKAEDAIRFQTNNEKKIYKASRKNHFEHASLATKTSGS
jgi:hypothetical protein